MSNTRRPTVYAKGIYFHQKEVNGVEVNEISFNVETFTDFLRDNIDSKGYVRVSAWKKSETDKFGSHNVVLNAWRPASYDQQSKSQGPEKGDLPF